MRELQVESRGRLRSGASEVWLTRRDPVGEAARDIGELDQTHYRELNID